MFWPTCKMLVEQYGGEVPREREALESLPGVGRKTANVVLNVAYGEHTLAVDTHVFRVANRTGLARAPRHRARSRTNCCVSFPHEFMRHAHHWLILHGRYICKARVPAVPALPDRALVRIRRKDDALNGKAPAICSKIARASVCLL